MMPRTSDGRTDDNTLVQRTAEVWAVCAVSLEAISVSPNENVILADNAGKNSAVRRVLEFGPLSQIEAVVVLIVAHRAPPDGG